MPHLSLNEFTVLNKGRINVSVFPNGIQKIGNIDYCSFSLLFGLNTTDESSDITNENSFGFIKEILNHIDTAATGIVLNIPGQTPESISPFGGKLYGPQLNNILPRWRRLLMNIPFVIKNDLQSLYAAAQIEGPVTRQFFNDEMFVSRQELASLNTLSSISTKTTESYLAELKDKIYNRDLVYESINSRGFSHASFLDRHQASKNSESEPLELLSLLNGIYQHPLMARRFGLVHDFHIGMTDPFIVEYFRQNSEKELRLLWPNDKIKETENFGYNTATPGALANMDIKDAIKITTFRHNAGIGERFYHGPANFGLQPIKNQGTEEGYFFTNINPDHYLNNETIVAESMLEVESKNESLFNLSEQKKSLSEGLFLFYKNDTLIEDENKRDEINGLGYSISVKEVRGDKKGLFSLCRRKVSYTNTADGNFSQEEEGWIQIRTSMSGMDASYNSNTIFHWTGFNLCIPKPGKKLDQKLTESEETGSGGMIGYNENGEGELIERKGFKYSYSRIPSKEVQLVQDTDYRFVIKRVLSNGFVLPDAPASPIDPQLSLSFLMDNKIPVHDHLQASDYTFFFDHRFSMENEPLGSPYVVARERFEGQGNKSPESSAHAVVEDESSNNSFRWVFPPAITLQQAIYLGLFLPETLGSLSAMSYVAKAKALAKRSLPGSLLKTEAPVQNSNVRYLADFRGSKLIISPADWFTRNYFLMATGNIALSLDDFFDYSRIYDMLRAGSITVKSLDVAGLQFKRAAGSNDVEIRLSKGLQFKFFLQVQDSAAQFVPTSAFAELNLSLRVLKNLYADEFNTPRYSKTTFSATHAVSKPDKPEPVSAPKAFRIGKNEKVHYSFYEFSLGRYVYGQAKAIENITSFTRRIDDGVSIPEGLVLNREKNKWLSQNTDSVLLEGEYPGTIFNQTSKNIIEQDVYRNKFGFEFRFNDEIAGKLNSGDEMVVFEIGTGLTAKLVFQNGNQAEFQMKNEKGSLDITQYHRITFYYCLETDEQSNFVLTLKVLNSDGTNIISPQMDINEMPYRELSHSNIKVLPKVELMLLGINDSQIKLDFVFHNDFFVYHSEVTGRYFEKECQLRTTGKFDDYFPLGQDHYYSGNSKSFKLLIENNVVPSVPVFQLTPVLFHERSSYQHSRTMQLMFEVERPLENGERFALVLAEKNAAGSYEPTPKTSAIGRDFTTSGNDFLEAGQGKSLGDFIIKRPAQQYLRKYLAESKQEVEVENYKLLILELFFDVNKKKWIAIVALNQEMLANYSLGPGKLLNSYNPFVKIVALRICKESTRGTQLSLVSSPKYMNIFTRRTVSVRDQLLEGKNIWKIEIGNYEQVKISDKNERRTMFIVAVRSASVNGIAGGIVESTEMRIGSLKKVSKFHVITDPIINIERIQNSVVCVYEYELYSNSTQPSHLKDFVNDPSLRLIYAEEF